MIDLTAAGRKLMHAHRPHHSASIVQEMSVLTAGEQAELGRLCRKLGLQEGTAKERGGGGEIAKTTEKKKVKGA